MTRRSNSSSYAILVERLLGRLDTRAQVPRRKRRARHKVPGARAEPFHRAPFLDKP